MVALQPLLYKLHRHLILYPWWMCLTNLNPSTNITVPPRPDELNMGPAIHKKNHCIFIQRKLNINFIKPKKRNTCAIYRYNSKRTSYLYNNNVYLNVDTKIKTFQQINGIGLLKKYLLLIQSEVKKR